MAWVTPMRWLLAMSVPMPGAPGLERTSAGSMNQGADASSRSDKATGICQNRGLRLAATFRQTKISTLAKEYCSARDGSHSGPTLGEAF
jgi:hypothetical protein